jgi:hypothetical protein
MVFLHIGCEGRLSSGKLRDDQFALTVTPRVITQFSTNGRSRSSQLTLDSLLDAIKTRRYSGLALER